MKNELFVVEQYRDSQKKKLEIKEAKNNYKRE